MTEARATTTTTTITQSSVTMASRRLGVAEFGFIAA
jgi:hypothetical protein